MKRIWQIISLLLLCGISGMVMADQVQDPTRPPWYQGEVPKLFTSPEVSAIVTGMNRKVAEVNGRWVHVGDLVDGWRVLSIEQRQVQLEKTGQTLLISLAPALTTQS